MSASFAAPADVEARWRTLTSDEVTVASTLLDDASDMIRTRWTDVDTRIASGGLSASSVARVTAGMVKRAMIAGGAEGVESRTQVAGPFQVSDKFANPTANLFLTAEDVRVFEGNPNRARTAWVI